MRRRLLLTATPGLAVWILGGSWALIDHLRHSRRTLWNP